MNLISEYLSFVCVLVLSVRCAIAWPAVGWPESIGLALVLAIHYGKKWFEQNSHGDLNGAEEELRTQMNQIIDNVNLLDNKISGINLQLGIKSIGSEERQS